MRILLLIIIIIAFLSGHCQEKKVLVDTLSVDSIVQVFHNNGTLFFQVPYKNGKQNGWYEQFHENGTLCIKELRIENKTVDGFNIAYWDNGEIYQKGYFKNGHEVGKWYCFTQSGEPFKIYFYNRKGRWIKTKLWNEEKGKWENVGFY